MAVTVVSTRREGSSTVVTAVSSLGGQAVFHWYVDGSWVGATRSGTRSFLLEPGEQVRLDVLDTVDEAFDPIASAPAGWSARRTLWFTRGDDQDVDHYRVEQLRAGGAWTVLDRIPDDGSWFYAILTPRLDDLTAYAWRVVPVDRAGNDGTARSLDAQTIVRTPNGVTFTATYAGGTQRVTFAAA